MLGDAAAAAAALSQTHRRNSRRVMAAQHGITLAQLDLISATAAYHDLAGAAK